MGLGSAGVICATAKRFQGGGQAVHAGGQQQQGSDMWEVWVEGGMLGIMAGAGGGLMVRGA